MLTTNAGHINKLNRIIVFDREKDVGEVKKPPYAYYQCKMI